MTVQIDQTSPLAEFSVWFESSLMASGRSKQTRDVYLGALRHLDTFLVANDMPRDLRKIRRGHVEAFMRDQLSRLKPASAAARYAGLRAFFKWALDEGEVAESPMASMSPPKVPDTQVKTLSESEVERLIKACEGLSFRQRRDTALIRFMLDTGARRAEAARIKVADLDPESRTAHIVKGKGNKDRVVVYSAATQQALFRYLRLREKHPHAESAFLWLGRAGALSPDAVAEIVARRSKRAGVVDLDGSPLHAHQLRHTWADGNLRKGMSEGDLMQLGGWANSDIMRRYGRDQARSRAIESARRIFEEAS